MERRTESRSDHPMPSIDFHHYIIHSCHLSAKGRWIGTCPFAELSHAIISITISELSSIWRVRSRDWVGQFWNRELFSFFLISLTHADADFADTQHRVRVHQFWSPTSPLSSLQSPRHDMLIIKTWKRKRLNHGSLLHCVHSAMPFASIPLKTLRKILYYIDLYIESTTFPISNFGILV
jgi:hypothetical protein